MKNKVIKGFLLFLMVFGFISCKYENPLNQNQTADVTIKVNLNNLSRAATVDKNYSDFNYRIKYKLSSVGDDYYNTDTKSYDEFCDGFEIKGLKPSSWDFVVEAYNYSTMEPDGIIILTSGESGKNKTLTPGNNEINLVMINPTDSTGTLKFTLTNSLTLPGDIDYTYEVILFDIQTVIDNDYDFAKIKKDGISIAFETSEITLVAQDDATGTLKTNCYATATVTFKDLTAGSYFAVQQIYFTNENDEISYIKLPTEKVNVFNTLTTNVYCNWGGIKINYELGGGAFDSEVTDNAITNLYNVYFKNNQKDLKYIPSKEGYAFDGWYFDSTFSNEVKNITVQSVDKVYFLENNQEVNGSLTIYAKWKVLPSYYVYNKSDETKISFYSGEPVADYTDNTTNLFSSKTIEEEIFAVSSKGNVYTTSGYDIPTYPSPESIYYDEENDTLYAIAKNEANNYAICHTDAYGNWQSSRLTLPDSNGDYNYYLGKHFVVSDKYIYVPLVKFNNADSSEEYKIFMVDKEYPNYISDTKQFDLYSDSLSDPSETGYFMISDLKIIDNKLYVLVKKSFSTDVDDNEDIYISIGAVEEYSINSDNGKLTYIKTYGMPSATNKTSYTVSYEEYVSEDGEGNYVEKSKVFTIYSANESAEDVELFSPVRFVGLEPKKLVIAENGNFFYKPVINGGDNYGNSLGFFNDSKQRITVIDLENETNSKSIDTTGASFEQGDDPYISSFEISSGWDEETQEEKNGKFTIVE